MPMNTKTTEISPAMAEAAAATSPAMLTMPDTVNLHYQLFISLYTLEGKVNGVLRAAPLISKDQPNLRLMTLVLHCRPYPT